MPKKKRIPDKWWWMLRLLLVHPELTIEMISREKSLWACYRERHSSIRKMGIRVILSKYRVDYSVRALSKWHIPKEDRERAWDILEEEALKFWHNYISSRPRKKGQKSFDFPSVTA